MSIRLSWKKIINLEKELNHLDPESKLTFYLVNKKKQQIKKTIPFRNFLTFFWSLYDTTNFDVRQLIITDQQGNTIYTYKRSSYAPEVIPTTGDPYIIENWEELNRNQKDAYLKILISQILSDAN